MIELVENRYGKSRVRLMQVTRTPAGNHLREWTVRVLLTGDFDSAHYEGDNSKILPTDTMKNTVYSVARNSRAESMEDYAKELIDFLLGRNPQVSSVNVSIEGHMWKRLTVDGNPFPTAFMRGSDERQTTTVSRQQDTPFSITSGLDRLTILKTSHSAFARIDPVSRTSWSAISPEFASNRRDTSRNTSPRFGPVSLAHCFCACRAAAAAADMSSADAMPASPSFAPVAFSITSVVPRPGFFQPEL